MTGNICVYCPGGPDSDFEYSTQSYTGYEPTSMRAIRARYDPYRQTTDRVAQLARLGHSVDKVEFIIMGGTFMSLPVSYKDYFVRNLHDALSGHSSSSVAEAIQYSEQSKTRCIGLTIETRPDYCLKPHISQMLTYGCTRLEIGVQSVYEDVARDTNRGHTVKAVTESFKLAKDSGYKIIAHMMPDLPNMGWERDIEGFKEYFENPDFRTDGLKLYPTLVIRGTGLYELWKTGRYKNYSPDTLIELLCQILAMVPPWTRVYRIQRDIPMPLVTSGVEHGNIRELVLKRMKELGLPCRDVRTREVGIKQIHDKVVPTHVELVRRDYTANGGWETFLAYEDPKQDILVGLLRLRLCSPEAFREEMKGKRCSIVRELHVYGSAVPVHSRDPTKFQHKVCIFSLLSVCVSFLFLSLSLSLSVSLSIFISPPTLPYLSLSLPLTLSHSLSHYLSFYLSHHQGFGILLMEEAERIAREEHGSEKLLVIAGVGTRHYYRKLGFELDGPYMSKML